MDKHSDIVTNAVARWNDVKANVGGEAKPTPLTLLNAIAGLPGVDPKAKTAVGALKREIPKATRHWNKPNLAFNQTWTALGPRLDAASTATEMVSAIAAVKAGGASVNLGPAEALVQAGQATVYDPAFVTAQPAPGNAADVAQLLRTGVKGAVKGVIGANGTPAEAVAVVASLTELVDQLW